MLRTMNERTVADLPDYPSLAHLATALWNDGQARGAAVLVGAGFSRNAVLVGRDTRRPPLWADLSGAMAQVLYGDRAGDAPKDPLRLAEEFRTYLGPAALVEFLREHVPDASWRPGPTHVDLMALPWADVLTTNYDTLLERTSDRHEVVRDAADLAQVRGRRVIKLHGSIDGNAHLVVTEEDYRTYPTRSAAFVNTARQVFIENELCLLGFSGDDPNFLQWSGWVRDHLAEGARRIYLVGSLRLSPAKRRLLESRNVAPIDFAPLTGHLPREEAENRACELFLAYLSASKPRRATDWQPAAPESYGFIPGDPRAVPPLMADTASAAALLEKLAAVWNSDMSNCPDWLVMPKVKRLAVNSGTLCAPRGFVKALTSVIPSTRAALLKRSAWRDAVTLEPLDDDVEAAIADLVVQEGDLPVGDRLVFLRTLLREARQGRNEIRFREIDVLLAAAAPVGSDAHADLVAQRLLWARDGLDLASVSSGLSVLEGPDPVWRLLRAALHCECGETELARPLVTEACTDLADRQRRDPRSMWVASRRAWADVFGRALRLSETWIWEPRAASNDVLSGYDADDEIDLLYRELRATRLRRIEEPHGYQPRFGPGAYQDHGRTVTFRSAALGYEAETVFRLADSACLPLRIKNVDVLVSLARDALESEPLHTLQWYLRLVRTVKHDSPALDRHFDSVSIARFETGMAAELTARVLAAVRFWQPRARPGSRSDHVSAVERLRALLEVLSRLIVRADPPVALEAFRLGRDMAANLAELHYWLYEPIGGLLRWCLVSLPPEQRSHLVLDCLEIPLPSADNPPPFRWPEPAAELFSRGTLPGRSPDDARWRACVANLLAAIGRTGPARTQAVHRLAYLATFGCLEQRERDDFGRLLWASRDPGKGGLPLDVDLYPHVIASLPGALDVDPESVVSAYLFETPVGSDSDQNRLVAVGAAAQRTAGEQYDAYPRPSHCFARRDDRFDVWTAGGHWAISSAS